MKEKPVCCRTHSSKVMPDEVPRLFKIFSRSAGNRPQLVRLARETGSNTFTRSWKPSQPRSECGPPLCLEVRDDRYTPEHFRTSPCTRFLSFWEVQGHLGRAGLQPGTVENLFLSVLIVSGWSCNFISGKALANLPLWMPRSPGPQLLYLRCSLLRAMIAKRSVCSHLIWSSFRAAHSDSSCVRTSRLSSGRSVPFSLRGDTNIKQSTGTTSPPAHQPSASC